MATVEPQIESVRRMKNLTANIVTQIEAESRIPLETARQKAARKSWKFKCNLCDTKFQSEEELLKHARYETSTLGRRIKKTLKISKKVQKGTK